jgi:tetrahydromethanopterin S-methyltransferase subunit G
MPRPTEVDRRLNAIEHRLDYIDTTGTRGTISLTTQVTNQGTDIAEIRQRIDGMDAKLDSAARMRVNQYIGFVMAILPIYVLLFMSLFHVTPA